MRLHGTSTALYLFFGYILHLQQLRQLHQLHQLHQLAKLRRLRQVCHQPLWLWLLMQLIVGVWSVPVGG